MHTQCRSCSFWLSPDIAAEGCPNCGCSGPLTGIAQLYQALNAAATERTVLLQELERTCSRRCPFSWTLLAAGGATLVTIMVGMVRLANGHLEAIDLGLLAKLLGLAELATVGIWWSRRLGACQAFEPKITAKEREIQDLRRQLAAVESGAHRARSGDRAWTRPCLQQDLHKIRTRLQEILRDRQHLDHQRQILLKEDPKKWNAALELIAAADTELVERSDRERIALREIALTQWVNQLEAYSLGIEELSVSECDRRLSRLKRVMTDGGALLNEWDREEAVNPLRTVPETSLGVDALAKGTRCRRQLERGLTVCQELIDGVQARRVVATVEAVSHQAADPTNEYVPRARKALEELTARSEIGQLRESFRQLEDLAAHSSARREVDRLTAHLGQS